MRQLSKQQIIWAKQHDWFIGITECGIGVLVNDRYTFAGKLYSNIEVFKNFYDLKCWAGY